MKTISDVCQSHRRTCFYDDGKGFLGVYNHRNVVSWYKYTVAGYSLVGETKTPQGAQKILLKTKAST